MEGINLMCIHKIKKKHCQKEYQKEYQKAYSLKNKEKIAEYKKEYHLKNKEKIAEYFKAYHLKNKDKRSESNKAYALKNNDNLAEYKKAYYQKNKEKLDKRQKAYNRERKLADPSFRLLCNMRCRLSTAVRNGKGVKSSGTMNLVGCDIDQLMGHLESQFTEGMTWENYGEWHVDHIKPCAKFDLMLDSEQKLCFHYTNLQPLWAEDNLKKSDKYDIIDKFLDKGAYNNEPTNTNKLDNYE